MCGKRYILDIPKMFEFMFVKNYNFFDGSNQIITETYSEGEQENTLSLMTKEISENKSDGRDSVFMYSSDLILTLVRKLMDVDVHDIDELSFNQRLIFDTFIEFGIIKEIGNKD